MLNSNINPEMVQSMWRDKTIDLNLITGFLKSIEEFQHFKSTKWEQIDEEAQMNNPMGTPGEDWIIPPDETAVVHRLEKDPEYVCLKKQILDDVPVLKEIAKFLNFDEHHDFDFVNFTSPLIGNDALEGSISMARKLCHSCENYNYTFQNLVALFKISK